jgi:hypothetical protein
METATNNYEGIAESFISEMAYNLLSREDMVGVAVEILTQLGIVIVYRDDTVKRREHSAKKDTPLYGV